jgi:hypothetical protein
MLVMGKTFDDHLRNLRIVFESFRTYGLKLKPRKCDLFKEEVVFLGRKVDKTGISMGDEYVEAVRNWLSRINGSLAFGNARTGIAINAFVRGIKAFSSASSHC